MLKRDKNLNVVKKIFQRRDLTALRGDSEQILQRLNIYPDAVANTQFVLLSHLQVERVCTCKIE